MPKERNQDTFRIPKITRIHPQNERRHHNHQNVHFHEKAKIQPMTTINYMIRSPSPISFISSQPSRSDTDDSEAESVEVITVPPPAVHRSRSLYHKEPTQILITPKPMSVPLSPYRRYFVTTTTPTRRVLTRTPGKTLMIQEIITPQPNLSSEIMSLTYEPKPLTWVTLLIATLSLLLAMTITAIIALAILLTIQQPSESFFSHTSISSACSANCMMDLTPFPQTTIASWPFDGSLSDLNNIYPTLYSNPPTIPYRLWGNFDQALDLSGSQYVYSSSQFMNLSYRSWTIEAWLLITDLSSDRGIFGQCESSSTTDRCLRLTIKSKRLHLGFNNDDLNGATIIGTSTTIWHHVAFVYDYTNMRQFIYLDGVLEASTAMSGISVGPYKGNAGQTMIGWVNSSNGFVGSIDHVTVTDGAKTACQILNDATLTAYYPFDTSGSYLDHSMNALHGVANSLITVSGRVNQAYAFQDSSSYFQSMSFTAYEPDEPFSVSLWVKPHNVNGGTLIHISTLISGQSHSCFDLLGFGLTGQIVGQVFNGYSSCCTNTAGTTFCPCQNTINAGGPIIPVNTWTHIVLTYSQSNGVALYTNGTLQDISDPFSSFSSATPDYEIRPYMTVGNPTTTTSNPSCMIGSPSLYPAAYQGVIDELRLYSRELSKNEICSLYHV